MLTRLYATEHKFPVEPDLETCQKQVTQEIIAGDFVAGKTILRHHSQQLAKMLIQLYNRGC
jgi:hypothetical protein